MKILAKSIKIKDNIDTPKELIEHIKDLLSIYDKIFIFNNQSDEKVKTLVKLCCLLHDLGKINIKFQQIIKDANLKELKDNNKISIEEYEKRKSLIQIEENINGEIKKLNIEEIKNSQIRHNLLTLAFVCNQLDKITTLNEIEKSILKKSILFHHGSYEDYLEVSFSKIQRAIYFDIHIFLKNSNIDFTDLEELIRSTANFPTFKISQDNLNYDYLNELNESFPKFEDEEENNKVRAKFILVKGFLNLIDHMASSNIIDSKNLNYYFDKKFLNSLDDELKKFVIEKSKNQGIEIKKASFKFNDIQENILNFLNDDVVITEAFTGKGKTITDDRIKKTKKFFLVPNKISATSFYSEARLKYGQNNVGIIHGDIHLYSTDSKSNEEKEDFISNETLELAMNLSKPYIIATVDQLVLAMFKYKNYEKTFASIFDTRICLDELHLLTPRMFLMFLYFMDFTTKYYKTKFHLMTATLPERYEKELENLKDQSTHELRISKNTSNIEENDEKLVYIECNYKRDNDSVCDLVNKLLRNELKQKDGETIKNRILIVKNTVKQVQNLYEVLCEKLSIEYKDKINCLHSKFKFKDKIEKYDEILKDSASNYDIWICTQSVEIALDLDFPYLIIDLSPMESLIQRIGRCNRRSKLDFGRVYVLKDNFDVYEKKLKDATLKLIKNHKKLSVKLRKELLEEYYKSKDVIAFYDEEFKKAKSDIKSVYGISIRKDEITSDDIMFRFEPYMNLTKNKAEASKLFRDIETNVKVYLEEDYNENISIKELQKLSLQISNNDFKKLQDRNCILKKDGRIIIKNKREDNKDVYNYDIKSGLKLFFD